MDRALAETRGDVTVDVMYIETESCSSGEDGPGAREVLSRFYPGIDRGRALFEAYFDKEGSSYQVDDEDEDEDEEDDERIICLDRAVRAIRSRRRELLSADLLPERASSETLSPRAEMPPDGPVWLEGMDFEVRVAEEVLSALGVEVLRREEVQSGEDDQEEEE
jgi:hypothetical protein